MDSSNKIIIKKIKKIRLKNNLKNSNLDINNMNSFNNNSEILNKLNLILSEIDNIKLSINNNNIVNDKILFELNNIKLKINSSNSSDKKIIPLVIDSFDNIDFDIVYKALLYHDYRSIVKMINYIYLPNDEYVLPFKYCFDKNNKKVLYYFNSDLEWVADDKDYIHNTIFKNMQNLFIKVNLPVSNSNDSEFLDNQDFIISKLFDKSFTQKMFKKIKDELLD